MRKTISRRDLVEGAVAFGASAAFVTPNTAAAEISESQKIPQADAKYQPTPKGQQRCEICLQFEQPDHCKIVQGPISVNGWCQYFAARENAH